jgi:hypothetical protein
MSACVAWEHCWSAPQEGDEVEAGRLQSRLAAALSADWVESYVTDDALTCVYIADDAEAVREHATCGGFPVTNICEVGSVIDPLTGAPSGANHQPPNVADVLLRNGPSPSRRRG